MVKIPLPVEPEPVELPKSPAPAVPEAFSFLLTQTDDHAAARAILDALDRAKIAAHESSNGQVAGRRVLLHVRPLDAERAGVIAGEIFARRLKFKQMPKVEQPPPEPDPFGLRASLRNPLDGW